MLGDALMWLYCTSRFETLRGRFLGGKKVLMFDNTIASIYPRSTTPPVSGSQVSLAHHPNALQQVWAKESWPQQWTKGQGHGSLGNVFLISLLKDVGFHSHEPTVAFCQWRLHAATTISPVHRNLFFWLWVLGPHMMTNWRKQHYISTWSLILHCINIILKLQDINTIYTYTQKCMVSCLGCTGWYKAMRSDLDETSEDELLDLLTCHRPATWISNSFPMCSSCGPRKFRIPKLFPYSWGFSWAICMGAAVSRCASEPEGWPWTPSAPHERWPHDFGGEACSWWIPRHTTWWVSTSWWVETSESITGCLWKKNHGPLYVLQVTKTRMYRWKGVGTLHYNHQSFPGEVFTDDV